MPTHSTTPCTPQHRCHRWQSCAQCAALDQVRFADRTEAILRPTPYPTLYTLIPRRQTPDGLRAAAAVMKEITAPYPAVWTFETGTNGGTLHLNVIGRYHSPPTVFDGRVYVEPIRTAVRYTALYIRKPSQRPRPETGITRSAGSWHQISEQLLRDTAYAPLATGAILQDRLEPGYHPAPATTDETDHQRARRWLAVLYERCPNLQPTDRGKRSI